MIRWLVACLLLVPPAHAAEITVLSAGAFKPVAAALIPEFEARSGNTVVLRNDTIGALIRRIKAGEHFDALLVSPGAMTELGGRIAPGSEVELARAGIGVAVKASAPKPDIGSVDAFKAAMLHASSVAYIDPASGGSSGIYIADLFKRLGIAESMAPKSVLVKGGLAAEAVADGRAELVVHQISEILPVTGVTLIGPLPAPIQHQTVYAGGVAADSAVPEAARAFLADLSGPAARSVLAAKGMSPPE